MNGFLNLESQRTEVNLSTVRNAFQARLADMDKTAADWGHWDDTFRYIVDKNAAYAKSNLAPEQLETIHLDTLIIFNDKGQVVSSRANDPSWRDPNSARPEVIEAIKSLPSLTHFTNVDQSTKGILSTPSGPLMIASRPVTRSNGKGPIRGAIVMARHLKEAEFEAIGKETHSDIEVEPFDSKSLSSDFNAAKRAMLGGDRTVVLTPSDDWIAAYAVLNDISGQPLLIVRAQYPRTILWEGQASVRVMLLALVFSSAALLAISLLMLNRFVLRRVIGLAKQVSRIEDVSQGDERVDDAGKDEISSLGGSINAMLEDLRASHTSVLDSEARLRTTNSELEAQGIALEQQNVLLAKIQADLKARNDELTKNESQLTAALNEAERSKALSVFASKRFQDLFDNLPVACFTIDNEDAVMEFNNASERLIGLPPEKIYGHPIDDLFVASDTSFRWQKYRQQVFDTELSIENLQARFVRPDGTEICLLTNVFPLRNADGAIIGVLCACIDVSESVRQREMIEMQLVQISESHELLQIQQRELADVNTRLEALATTDGLTGLINHRAFQDFLDTQYQLAQRSLGTVSVLLMDVDFFKQYNDTYGHLAGDEVLKKLAATLTESARGMDFIARYGGEEFVVVLPATDADGAIHAAERYREAIESQDWPDRTVTVSIGVATLGPNIHSKTDLITAADQALYESKRAGRNRVTHACQLPRAA